VRPTGENTAEEYPRLYTLKEVEPMGADCPWAREAVSWVHNYLVKPHPHLGRAGPVCPFATTALALNTIWIGELHARGSEKEKVGRVVANCRDRFLELEPRAGEAATYKALLIVFPGLSLADAPGLIDCIQRRLKPEFVERGLMIGEFHGLAESPGVHNEDFRPLRSAVPMIAIRFMVESDVVFLNRGLDPPELRVRFLEAYLNHLGPSLSAARIKVAKESLEKAIAEMHRNAGERDARKDQVHTGGFGRTL
jgi:hypothetical protein